MQQIVKNVPQDIHWVQMHAHNVLLQWTDAQNAVQQIALNVMLDTGITALKRNATTALQTCQNVAVHAQTQHGATHAPQVMA